MRHARTRAATARVAVEILTSCTIRSRRRTRTTRCRSPGGNSNTNAAWIASNTSRLPAGAIKVEYEIDKVSLNASEQPVMEFRLLQNGVARPPGLRDGSRQPGHRQKEIWANFMGSPSVYFVFAVPQDGITAPADFNGTRVGLPAQHLERHVRPALARAR